MKINFLSTLILSVLMMFSLQMIAQQEGRGAREMDPEMRAERQTNRMKELLNLNDAQYEMIYAINLESAMQMAELWKSADGNREALREKMVEMRTDIDKKIVDVLDEEQQAKYKQSQEDRQGRMREGRQRRGQRDGQGPKPKKDGK